ncbi:MAG TPA: hypothetical protein VK539_00395 [Myxococcaceae bacterium]|nr:hypothetical protein [Myxococcaceae bacterium]
MKISRCVTVAARFSAVVLALFLVTPVMADVSEASVCAVPQEIKFVREPSWLGWQVVRYTRYPGETALTRRYKNVEQRPWSAPSHITNCTPGSSGKTTQKITFKLKTKNYFNAAVGDHIAVALRANWYGQYTEHLVNGDSLRYQARGVIFRREPWFTQTKGISGEMFDIYHYDHQRVEANSPTETLSDGIEYSVTALVTATHVTYTLSGGFVIGPTLPTPRTWTEDIHHPLSGIGFGVAVLCGTSSVSEANCDAPYPPPADPSMSVHFYDINVSWQ